MTSKPNPYLERIQKLNADYTKKSSTKKQHLPKNAGSILYSYTEKLVNHRVLDMYLKALGITTLTPLTLVPLALVMGSTTFSDTVSDILALEKRATGKKPNKKKVPSKDDMYIPILDDSVFGTYAKYAGVGVQLALSPFTLVPLGLAMFLYEMFTMDSKKEQKGGGSSWVMSQNSGGPINSPNLWANYLSSKFSAFGREMTPIETQAITGYPFQQPPNTLLTIAPLSEPLGGLGTGPYAAAGGRRKRRRQSRKKLNSMYTRRRSKSKSATRRSRSKSR